MTEPPAAPSIVVTGMGVKWLRQNAQEDSAVIKTEHTFNHSEPSRKLYYVEKHVLHVF